MKRPKTDTQTENQRKRLSSPERFEIKQLLASGAVDPKKHRELVKILEDDLREERHQQTLPVEGEVEIYERVPAFVRRQQASAVVDPDPLVSSSSQIPEVKTVTRNPVGTMARAAFQAMDKRESRNDNKQRLRPDLRPLFRQSSSRGLCDSRPELAKKQEDLPIAKLKRELLQAVDQNPVLVVIGETGSGKTTQITQYLIESKKYKSVACTQPRRVAAISVAKRVAEEMGCRVGTTVGYSVRFEDRTGPSTVIKYMTDGMLLRECLVDPLLFKYSVIVLDEAHERTVHTDVLFGLCKQAMRKRVNSENPLKLVVTSATLQVDKFSKYFDDCPVFKIPGRSYPVEIVYEPEPVVDYLQAAVQCCLKIHRDEPPIGDILMFLTGQDEIDTAVQWLNEGSKQQNSKNRLELLPMGVYASMPSDQQSLIFQPTPDGYRKAVIATNIAETSITIPNIRFVIDPGFVKMKTHTARLSMDTLQVSVISRAQAQQRSGRAGRTAPGKCYRLYTEQAYNMEMADTAVPEIQRSNLALVVLGLKAMGVGDDLLKFDFMDRPPLATLLSAMETLYQLGAIDEEGFLTHTGKQMSEFPVDPPLGKMIISGRQFKCADAILKIVSVLSAIGSSGGGLFLRVREQDNSDSLKSKHMSKRAMFGKAQDGDLISYLNVYQKWTENHESSMWSSEHLVNQRTLLKAKDIYQQLKRIYERLFEKIDLVDDDDDASDTDNQLEKRNENVRRAVCGGLFRQAARRDASGGDEGTYKTLLDDHPASIHPSSCLATFGHHQRFVPLPKYILYCDLVMTQREWLREVTPVEPEWLIDAAPSLYKNPSANLSEKQRRERIVPLHNRNDRNEDWRISRQASYYRAARSR